MIDTRLITFLTIADTGSFTKAAELLNLTQPAVSQQVKYLEVYYDVKLIRKIGRNIKMTEEGILMCEYIRKMQAMERSMKNHIHNQSSVVKRYKIGATKTIGGYVAPDLLGGYKRLFPNTEVILEVANTKDTIRKLLNGESDLALVEGPFDKTKYEHVLLQEDELVAAFSSQHPFAQEEGVELKAVLQEHLIIREQGSGTREIMENHLLAKGYRVEDWHVFMEIGDITAIKSLIRWNLGYSFISKAAVQTEVAEGSIHIVPIKDFCIKRGFYFVWGKEGPPIFINSFIDFCQKHKNNL